MASTILIQNTLPTAGRVGTAARAAGQFILHFAEMVVAMMIGMMAFMAIPGVMQLPKPVHLAGMAIAMSLPMVLWMKVRGHGYRHGLEMSAAMILPWAAVLVAVALGAAKALPVLGQAESPAMLLGMVVYMLVRHEHYGHGGHSHGPAAQGRLGRRLRELLKPGAYVSAIVLLPLVVALANLLPRVPSATLPPAPTFGGFLPATPAPNSSKHTAVLLSSAYGAEITDILPPYEMLARSGAFNVYTVAPERKPLPLGGGDGKGTALDFVPQLSFADYESRIGTAPDLMVIPYFPGYSADRDALVVDWIRSHFGPNTTILTICAAGLTLADTGLLEGRTATTNTSIFDVVQQKAPTATLIHNVRYLDDGNLVTSEDLTTGIDATLHVIDRFAGRATALQVASQVGYTQTGSLDDPRYTLPSPRFSAILSNAAFTFRKEHLGVLLYDGVSEFGLAGIIEPYGGSLTTEILTMAPQREAVVGSSGFVFIPRHAFDANPDRVVLPPGRDDAARQAVAEAWAKARPGRAIDDTYAAAGKGQTAYDLSLSHIAQTRGAGLARADANTLLYPANQTLPQAGWPLLGLVTPLVLAFLAAAAVFTASRLATARQQPRLELAAA